LRGDETYPIIILGSSLPALLALAQGELIDAVDAKCISIEGPLLARQVAWTTLWGKHSADFQGQLPLGEANLKILSQDCQGIYGLSCWKKVP